MKTNNSCKFCSIIDSKFLYPGIDEPFFENSDYIAFASIGAFVEGWTLIVPKEHGVSMRKHYKSPIFSHAVSAIVHKLESRYGNVIAFEHGANRFGSSTGCGTDHAHFHLVPSRESLKYEIESLSLKWTNCTPCEIEKISNDKEYLFYLDMAKTVDFPNLKGMIHILDFPKSQFFRKIIAKNSKIGCQYDYKKYPYYDKSKTTNKTMRLSFRQ